MVHTIARSFFFKVRVWTRFTALPIRAEKQFRSIPTEARSDAREKNTCCATLRGFEHRWPHLLSLQRRMLHIVQRRRMSATRLPTVQTHQV